ncbi:MAG: glycosyltransferase family 4 protein [Armatimonadota bacterium]|nr:glycosyltransferase family 4 protein [bacterium]
MKKKPSILIVNSIPSHHIVPVAEALYRLLGDNLRVVFNEPVDDERKAMGWNDNWRDYPWIIRTWESEHANAEFHRLVDESDALVCSEYYTYGNPEWIRRRLANSQLCFTYCERHWKPSRKLWTLKPTLTDRPRIIRLPIHYYRLLKHMRIAQSMNADKCHMLAMGAYAAWDEARIGMFHNRMWTWGYFVEDSTSKRSEPGDIATILWAGRMLDWKCVDTLLYALAEVKERGLRFRAKIVGDGPERDYLVKLQNDLHLSSEVEILPFMKSGEIRLLMAQTDIYVLPSNYEEGWGAVINEAMTEGCAVIACDGAGAAPVLINHGDNGFRFPVCSVKDLAKHLAYLIADRDKSWEMGNRARQYIEQLWSPDVGAARLVSLINGLLGWGNMPQFQEGPCSRAQIIKPALKNRFRPVLTYEQGSCGCLQTEEKTTP